METEATATASASEPHDPSAAASHDEAATEPTPTGDDADLRAELSAARALASERLNELAYARAEIDNVRKRAMRSADERLVSHRKALLAKFLPVLDNLQRALAFDDSEGLRGGLGATLRSFENLLAGEGVVAIEMLGKPFDPHVAEAIATRETTEHADDVVVEDVQRGYRLGEELLRPAMVIVAKRTDS
jgi:molecular chaperone GrpE